MGKALVIAGADFSLNALDSVVFDVIHCTGILLSNSTLSFDSLNDTAELIATVTPSDCEETVIWASSDPNCCIVSGAGLVTVVGVGTCTITATCGRYSATCVINVEVEANVSRVRRSLLLAPNDTNNYSSWGVYGPTGSYYGSTMTAFNLRTDNEQLILGYQFVPKSDGTAYLPDNIADNPQTMAKNLVAWGFNSYGIPIRLPNNCKHIRTSMPSTDYASRVVFFKKDVRVKDSPSVGDGEGYFTAARMPMASTYEWVYDGGNTVDLPDGYDSIGVVFKANTGSTYFTDMTDEQLEQFKVYFS